MHVSEIMSRQVRIASPTDTLQQAARWMAELDAGALPIGDDDRLVGMITDRDIAIRGDAAGCDPTSTPISQIMSKGAVKYCFEDEDIESVARNMAELQVRRLPVVNRDKRLVGIVSLGDLSRQVTDGSNAPTDALRGISEPNANDGYSRR
jgi:CBS domain-containing protein